MKRLSALLLGSLSLSCDPVLPEVERPPGLLDETSLTLLVDPADRGAAVVRLSLEGSAVAAVAPADVWLVEGIVSDVSLARWAEGDPPKTLLEHKVSTTSFVEGDVLRLIPHEPLTLALEYSVILRIEPLDGEPAADPLALTFWTAESAPFHATRRWPPQDVEDVPPLEVERGYAVYCREDPLDPALVADATTHVSLEPSGPRGTFSLLGERCILFTPEPGANERGMFHPPRSWAGVDLDPAPIRIGTPEAVEVAPLVCKDDEFALGALCARAQDDRVQFRAEARPALYVVEAGVNLAMHVGTADGVTTFELRGLEPATTIELTVHRFSADATEASFAEVITTLPQPHVDIAEVMADPNGPEPQQEWIELHNEGLGAVELEGWVLADAAGEIALTAFTLEADARVLLVREGFVDDTLDPERLMVLAKLGGNGLSNSGEALELRDAEGAVRSTFPSAPKPKAGISTSLVIDGTGARTWLHTDPPTPLAPVAAAQ